MKESNFLKILIILFLISLFFSKSALSQIVTCRSDPCSWEDFSDSLKNLFRKIVEISYWIAFLMATIGSFLIMFHGPNENLYKKGVTLVKTAIFGYIAILFSGIIIDLILDFFKPKFAFAFDPQVWYQPLRDSLLSSLKCGAKATSPLDKLFSCIFEAIGFLKNLAIVFLVGAIIASAFYLITTPIFGFKQIERSYKIIIYSILGLIVILLADLIKKQIEALVK